MTEQEKIELQTAWSNWAKRPNPCNFASWVLDESTGEFVPPIPKPTDSKNYRFNGTTNSWETFE
jgi:hypothetical protein